VAPTEMACYFASRSLFCLARSTCQRDLPLTPEEGRARLSGEYYGGKYEY
jgi:hypothetical protein